MAIAALAVAALCGCGSRHADHADSPTAKREKQLLDQIAKNPGDMESQLSLASLYYDTKRPRQAIPVYLKVLKERPDDANVRSDLGQCYAGLGNLQQAIAEFERVLAKDPKHLQADLRAGKCRLALANQFYDMGRFKEAIPYYKKVLEKDPDNPNVRTDMGTCYKRLNALQQAVGEYEIVLKKTPNHIQANYNLAVVVQLLGDNRRAAKIWDHITSIAPESQIGRASKKYADEARQTLSQGATSGSGAKQEKRESKK